MLEMRPIDVLNNLKNHTLWPQSYHLSEAEAKVCVEALENYISPKWISIDERLPEVDKYGCSDYVLLSFSNCSTPIVGRYEEDEDGAGNFYAGDDDEPLIKVEIFVNAWMPLPKCTREE